MVSKLFLWAHFRNETMLTPKQILFDKKYMYEDMGSVEEKSRWKGASSPTPKKILREA